MERLVADVILLDFLKNTFFPESLVKSNWIQSFLLLQGLRSTEILLILMITIYIIHVYCILYNA